ncbi:hypothetical protein F5878DRAFT_699884 [Lentinula raphanica]|uniref:CxC2-like cysteine cluster KDZ transposase-associated domain-containing protein n=1 Tax=Lentinula raphanica TaxID=153919 RepID=A0AA38NZ86_9AGAR|nr:hypothetical protein F5878DRAFT_699884 [Lentinula raphanica]
MPCPCGGGTKLVQCQDCQEYVLSCRECWIASHLNNPWHWARVWNGSFFVRSDISALRENFAIQLGHSGKPCPTLDQPKPVKFTVTHSNGVHGTCLSFCNCGQGSRVQQLMRARLFPASLLEPETAFTFTVLREYDIHSLQAKIPAYDYLLSLRRLTDNVHTHRVNDPYQIFMLVARIWRYLKTRIRTGEIFNINEVHFPHRPAHSLILYCPVCPDPAINMVGEWWKTPDRYRHLIMMYSVCDGNMKLNQFHKNSGSDDKSLFQGNSYFPPLEPYKEFLITVKKSPLVATSSDCGHVKVINKQMHQSSKTSIPLRKVGVATTACNHVFIQAVTDMYGAERFSTVFEITLQQITATSFLTSSHMMQCATSHRISIFDLRSLSIYAHIAYVERGVPDMHMRGHNENNCQEQYSLPYHWCNAHVHGEAIEQPWVEFNQVGGYTRQMKDGHREDTLISHVNDWNFKKLVNIYHTPAHQLKTARVMYQDSRNELEQLSHAHKDNVAAWSRIDRTPRPLNGSSKTWISVYHRYQARVPSVRSLLINWAREKSSVLTPSIFNNGRESEAEITLEAYWLKAIEAENLRSDISEVIGGRCYTLTEKDEDALIILRERLTAVLDEFRVLQAVVTPGLPPRLLAESCSADQDMFKLGLPSDLTPEERIKYDLSAVAEQECRLRESQITATILSLKHTCNRLLSLQTQRERNVDTEKQRTRAGKGILRIMVTRDVEIAAYNEYRRALISLGVKDAGKIYPPLTAADTFKKDTHGKRHLR